MFHAMSYQRWCILWISLLMSGMACTSSEKNAASRQEQLQILLDEQERLQASITRLKKELNLTSPEKKRHLDTFILRPRLFRHYINLQASVEGNENVVVMPKGGPGVVEQIFIQRGAQVKKGQILLRINDTMVAAQMNNLQTRLDLAKDILARQEKLWAEKIGSEIALTQRRNDVAFLETQMAALKTNQSLFKVTAPVDGIVDALELQVGEIFTGYAGNVPQLRIVNLSSLKARIWVPDIYVTQVRRGSLLQFVFLDSTLLLSARVSSVSKYINPTTRSFLIEAPLPSNPRLRLNMTGKVRILDYENHKALVIPVDMLQSDGKQSFVYVLVPTNIANDYILVKKSVRTGKVQDNEVEILSGLNSGDIFVSGNGENLQEGAHIAL